MHSINLVLSEKAMLISGALACNYKIISNEGVKERSNILINPYGEKKTK